jgi:hypothetical protein
MDPVVWMAASAALTGLSNWLSSRSNKEAMKEKQVASTETTNRGLNLQGIGYLADQRDKARKMGDTYRFNTAMYDVLTGHQYQ